LFKKLHQSEYGNLKPTTMKKATILLAFLLFAAGLMAQSTAKQDTITTVLSTGEIAVFSGCDGCTVVIVFLSADKVIVRQMPENKPKQQPQRQTKPVTVEILPEGCTCEGCVKERASRTKEKYK